VLVIIIGECIHRKNLRTPVALKTAKDIVPSLTLKEFNIEIENGSNLVILDNLVLDITDFINEHPGGRFVLKHNIGKDISKFFFGGYCLEGNL
jgi:stearoyl-CoA desaturase (delta-9 desaturase)